MVKGLGVAVLLSNTLAMSGVLHVSPNGSGAKDGSSWANAYAGPAAAVSVAKAGDTILLQGGTYKLTTTLKLASSGTAASRIHLFSENAATKRAMFDFSGQAVGSSSQGVYVSGAYWHIKGLDVFKAGDNGILFQGGSNNILEFCNVHENQDAGVQLKGGAANNLILNTDSWWNYDSATSGGNADGFAPKMDVGSGNTFRGCRSWGNSDDGWDGYLREASKTATWTASTTIEDSWAFDNGYYHGDPKSTKNDRAEMNGNGFKMGGGDKVGTVPNGYGTQHHHVLRRCLAFNNYAKGFDQNNNRGSMTIYNSTGVNNGTNYQIDGTVGSSATPSSGIASGNALIVKNSVSFGTGGVKLTNAQEAANSWLTGFALASGDFQSVDTSGVRAARKPDGSLPDLKFMNLSGKSVGIDKGVLVPGVTYDGSAPDLGAFEVKTTSGVEPIGRSVAHQIRLQGAALRIESRSPGEVRVAIVRQDGRIVRDLGRQELAPSGTEIRLGELPRGVSLCRLAFSDGTIKSVSLLAP